MKIDLLGGGENPWFIVLLLLIQPVEFVVPFFSLVLMVEMARGCLRVINLSILFFVGTLLGQCIGRRVCGFTAGENYQHKCAEFRHQYILNVVNPVPYTLIAASSQIEFNFPRSDRTRNTSPKGIGRSTIGGTPRPVRSSNVSTSYLL